MILHNDEGEIDAQEEAIGRLNRGVNATCLKLLVCMVLVIVMDIIGINIPLGYWLLMGAALLYSDAFKNLHDHSYVLDGDARNHHHPYDHEEENQNNNQNNNDDREVAPLFPVPIPPLPIPPPGNIIIINNYILNITNVEINIYNASNSNINIQVIVVSGNNIPDPGE